MKAKAKTSARDSQELERLAEQVRATCARMDKELMGPHLELPRRPPIDPELLRLIARLNTKQQHVILSCATAMCISKCE